ncbi:MAG: DUF4342 domain-containing protein [Acidobacteriota bacterium]|jgi:hypothetical protein
MQERTIWETIRLQGSEILEKLKQIIHEGNARRVVIKQGEHVIAEFPLSAGVVGTLVAPVLAAVGALVALVKDCSIEVERSVPGAGSSHPADLTSDK